MVAKKKNVTSVDVDGVSVQIDNSFTESWDGLMLAAEMQRLDKDSEASEGVKMAAVIEYYTRSITNLDEVVAALGGGGVPAAKVFETLGVAIQKASSKN